LSARGIEQFISENKIKVFDEPCWLCFLSSGSLHKSLATYPSTQRILFEFLRDKEFGKHMRSVFWRLLLSGKSEFTMDITSDETLFLGRLGLITPISLELHTFTLGPSILQDCVILGLAKEKDRQISRMRLPFLEDKQLDVLETFKIVLQHVDREHLRNSYDFATKTSEIRSITGQKDVLKEAVYSLEVVTVLRAWFPLEFNIIPEVGCEGTMADILITCAAEQFSIIFEFLANERYQPENRRSSMLGHIVRAKDYATKLNSTAWIIHFIGVSKFPSTETQIQFPDNPACSCIYVYHLHDFSEIRVYSKLVNNTKNSFILKF
jgi:hypothetical protein